MPGSAAFGSRVYDAARRIAAELFAIPVLGYGLRIVVGILKLPRLNLHLRRLDTELQGIRRRLDAELQGISHRLDTELRRLDTELQAVKSATVDRTDFAAQMTPLTARVAALDGELQAMKSATVDRADFAAQMTPLTAQVAALDTELQAMKPATVERADFEAQMTPLTARVATLEVAWRQDVPVFLNAVGTVPAFGHELADLGQRLERATARLDNADASTRALWERLESLGHETPLQGVHGDDGRSGISNPRDTISRVLAPEKIAAARKNGALRLNLCYVSAALSDYVNVDVRDLPGVDVIAEVTNLPFEPGSVDEIFSAHLVEHFPPEAMEHRLLPYWRSLLRPGGTFRVITSDAAAMIAEVGAGTYALDDFRETVFGRGNGAGDHHHNLFTADSLRRMLQHAGFADIEIPVMGRRNGKCFEFEICARRV